MEASFTKKSLVAWMFLLNRDQYFKTQSPRLHVWKQGYCQESGLERPRNKPMQE